MRSLYLRIYLTVVAVLLLFALVAGFLAQRNLEHERASLSGQAIDRAGAWAMLLENSLPPASAPEREQRRALLEWSERLRMPLALDAPDGRRIATSEPFLRHEREGAPPRRAFRLPLSDGRVLWVRRPMVLRAEGLHARRGEPPPAAPAGPPMPLRGGAGLAVMLVVLFLAIAIGAWPVVRRLTRRLEALQRGVEQFGAGRLAQRVDDHGRDEVAAVAKSFNQAAERVEALVRSNQSLLANASHELRSPLARLKMAVSMLDDAPPEQRERLRREIHTNIGELDALVEEVLLASRLDAQASFDARDGVDLLALAAEEAARVDAVVQGSGSLAVRADERLLRRALRNLLENARRYGGSEVEVTLRRDGAWAEAAVCDRGPGVPEGMRARIFEPFFRLPGHAEREGGVGLGLSLVKQIAERHGGTVRCTPRDGGGSCFVLRLPVSVAGA